MAMEFDPTAFIDLAESLLAELSPLPTPTSKLDQARVRASIGRSYYGAYLVAREKLVSLGGFVPTGRPEDHSRIVESLGGFGSELGGRLDRLRAKRNKDDYNLNSAGFTLQSGRFWLTIAQDLAKDISSLK
ncbi:MAG: hypothetical protein HY673_03690 [Chloroflexi bacterium]|nr:hypothetical protein [Chloroflexota bacterium]